MTAGDVHVAAVRNCTADVTRLGTEVQLHRSRLDGIPGQCELEVLQTAIARIWVGV